jgi:hypothetical protein
MLYQTLPVNQSFPKWWAVLRSNQWPLPCETVVRGLTGQRYARAGAKRNSYLASRGVTPDHAMSSSNCPRVSQCRPLAAPKVRLKHKRSQALVLAGARTRGRPPFRPFLRAAAALASDDPLLPTRPNSAIHAGPANTDDTRAGTLRSKPRRPQCRPPPRPSTWTERPSLGGARLKPGMSLSGMVSAAPLVSSIRSSSSRAR